MSIIKVLLADDHADGIEIMEHFMGKLVDFYILGSCANGEELVHTALELNPDLIIADINMPIKNGMEAMKECAEFNPGLKFIFVTGYDEFAVGAFHMEAVDYIVKPLEKNRFYQALDKAKEIILAERQVTQGMVEKLDRLPIKAQQKTYYIPFADIYFIEKSGVKCLVYTKERVYETSEILGNLQEKLNNSFFLAHRSYVVNLKKISHITPQKETFVAYFHDFDMQASISKLKINELKELMEIQN
ncbi:LytR/AlgR family response regulator transcription factor [Falsibacillus pallidus]|uniref:LytTR family two component transcriptional regulator n=1 Tax=Falsibacillus pallidus TaxID=493781 RepID=A0A370GAF7_9BACI|nr:LytTR family DNA-binding domain-containing protein [Falsibacillus pallidus]RDI40019.1 LytTR family two component transcriptional regulator [Falsibacillus pallidus]